MPIDMEARDGAGSDACCHKQLVSRYGLSTLFKLL